jgi:uncharacterized sodium:solute symporter family permease YidK
VLQFFLIWAGAFLIPVLGLYEARGWNNLKLAIAQRASEQYVHVWAGVGSFSNNPMGINWVGVVFGLGAVISMGYWTTDFLVVQRILSAKDMRSAYYRRGIQDDGALHRDPAGAAGIGSLAREVGSGIARIGDWSA